MARAAEAIARLGTAVGQGVDHPGGGKIVERPVDGRQAHPPWAPREATVNGLGRRIVRLAREHLQHRDPPAGRADARSAQPFL